MQQNKETNKHYNTQSNQELMKNGTKTGMKCV